MSDSIDYLRRDADHVMAAWNRMLVWYSVGEVDEPQVRDMTRCFDVMAERYPDGFCFVLYAKDTCKLPNSAGRKAASLMFAAQKERLTGMVALFQGHGFFMASARAILSTMLAIARQPFESQVSGDPVTSTLWVASRTPELSNMPDASSRMCAVLEQIANEHAALSAA